MRAVRKIALSLLISTAGFSLFILFAYSGFFSYIEANFYDVRVRQQIVGRLDATRNVLSTYEKRYFTQFESLVAQNAVRRIDLVNQSAQDIFDRKNLFDKLLSEYPGILYVRFVDSHGNIHFSTLDSDILQSNRFRTVYKTLNRVDPHSPYTSELESTATTNAVYLEGATDKLLFRVPWVGYLGKAVGSAVFYLGADDVRSYLIKEGELGTGRPFGMVGNEGFLLGTDLSSNEKLQRQIASEWKTKPVFGSEGIPIASDAAGKKLVLFTTRIKGLGYLGDLVPQSQFTLNHTLRLLLSASIFLTLFLLVLLILSLRQDRLVVLADRIKRFQINFLREYVEGTSSLDWGRWRIELEHRRAEVRREIKKGIGRVGKDGAAVDDLIDRSWDDILGVIGRRVEERQVSQNEVRSLEEAIRRLLSSGEFAVATPRGISGPIAQPDVPQTRAGVISEKTAGPEHDVGPVEEVEAAEELEEAPEGQGTAEPAEAGSAEGGLNAEEVEEVEEVEELEEVEAVEELEEAPEGQGTAEPAEAGSAEGGLNAEEVEEVEEVEELEEVEAAEELEEAPESQGSGEPAEAGSAEEGLNAEEVEELEEVSEAERAKGVAAEGTDIPPASSDAESLPAVTDVFDDMEALDLEAIFHGDELLADIDVFDGTGSEEVDELEAEADEIDEYAEELEDVEPLEATHPEIARMVAAQSEDAEELEVLEIADTGREGDPTTVEIGAPAEELEEVSYSFSLFKEFHETRSVSFTGGTNREPLEGFSGVPGNSGAASTKRDAAQSHSEDAAGQTRDVPSGTAPNKEARQPVGSDRRAAEKTAFVRQLRALINNKKIGIYVFPEVGRNDLRTEETPIEVSKGVLQVRETMVGRQTGSEDRGFRALVDSVVHPDARRVGNTSIVRPGSAADADRSHGVADRQGPADGRGRARGTPAGMRLTPRGLDYDSYRAGFKSDTLGITKSLMRLSQRVGAIYAAILLPRGGGLTTAYSLGLDARSVGTLRFESTSPVLRYLFLPRKLIQIRGSETGIRDFDAKIAPADLQYMKGAIYLPIVFGSADAYLFLGLKDSTLSIRDYLPRIVAHQASREHFRK